MLSETGEKILDLVPSLRAFAFCLTQDRPEADDLVYNSLIEIWQKHRFKKMTELKIAAFTIIDRRYRTGIPAHPSTSHAAARSHAENPEPFSAAFGALGRDGREALSLVTVWALTSAQAAKICGTDRRTLERRVAGACRRLTSNQPKRIPPRVRII